VLRDAELHGGDLAYLVSGKVVGPTKASHVTLLISSKFLRQVNAWVGCWQPTDPTFIRKTSQGWELSGITVAGGQVREHLLKVDMLY
jgi:hypothetical protein